MRKYSQVGMAALALMGLAVMGQPANAQDKPAAAGTLKVKLSYTGAGAVDEKHKVFLFLFDTPDFVQGNAMPVGSESATTKNATVTFAGIAKSPVYLVAIYDPAGAYEGMSPPPSGSSIKVYGKTPGQPDAIAVDAGKTTQIDVTFDDSAKMP
jgi:hypothetical protein